MSDKLERHAAKSNTMVTPPGGEMRFWRRPAPQGLVFILTGTLHFLLPDYYLRIIPPFLPHGRVLVYLSGAAEVLGGLGVLERRWRRAAGLGLILLLVAVFPANVQMLLLARAARAPGWKEALLWLRLPLQGALVTWVWIVTRDETRQCWGCSLRRHD